ncbi:synaptotagmin-6 isoform X2 [Corythoichthys intestinalis]|uniref:synaptotagmin-6 isoform X2 n=1 Tax=Corythoichthys intestinalis TaxID=161448 RepID=UPI0025A50E00|nr:synaptotagmin-6 isoform X2 [Corythoichthys intestinalis]
MMALPSGYFTSGSFLSTAGALRFPFSNAVKYSILGLSVTLLLVALGILAWQAFRCFKRPSTRRPQSQAVNGHLFYGGELTGQYREIPTIKGFDGWLHYSLYYDEQQHHLVVTILKVEGFQDQKPTSSHQLFVQIKLLWTGCEKDVAHIDERSEGTSLALCTVLQDWQTRIVKGTCNPLFGDQFSCILRDEQQLDHIALRMEVKNFDKFSRHTALGEVRTSLGQLNISYPLELKGKLITPRKDLVGEVLLSLRFLPTSQRIEVGVLKVRTIHKEKHMDADSALYVRISVQCDRCKLKYQKTSAVTRGTMTVFNEVLVFSLPEFPLQQCKILVSLYGTHLSKKSPKQLIGQLMVKKDKNSENEHWDLMLRSVRQPIARWHALLI